MVWAAISLEVKTSLIFMLRDEENENNRYTTRPYIMALENGIFSIHQPGQLFQQDNV